MSQYSKLKSSSKDRDGLYKRRGYWHFEYSDPQTGRRKSKSSGAMVYADAKTIRRDFLEQLKGNYNPSNDRMRFADAADAYMQHRQIAVAAGTLRLQKERLRQLGRVLIQLTNPDVRLKDINLKLVRLYQQTRIGEGVGPRTVNMEGQVLRSILKHHEQWTLDGKYKALPEPVSEAGRSLTPEEEVRLLDTAKSKDRWFVAYHGTILENETGMRGVEVRNLQLRRIDFVAGEIRLQKSKTKGGVRIIPLNADALASAKDLLARAQRMGATLPDHYLIPALVTETVTREDGSSVRFRRYDSTKPVGSWRTAWRKLTREAGLRGLRGHDLRHNWVTSHAEVGTAQSVLEAQAGHLSKRMSDHYKHISEKAARKATDEHARIKAQQRTEARARLQEESRKAAAADSATGQCAMIQ